MPLPVPPTHHLVLVKPARSADTGETYRAYDAAKTQSARSVDPVISALRSKSLPALAAAVGNDLASVTRALVPEVAALEQLLVASGASGASMSGSGTAVYGVFDDESAAESAKATVDAPGVGVYTPVPYGVEIA